MGEKGKKKGEKGGKGGEERPKNSARPSRTHNNNTLSSAHATAGTLQGRRRTRHTHTSFFFFFFIISFGREIFFLFSGRSFIMWFDSAHSPARARAFIECPPNFFFFLADRIGSPDRIPSIFSFFFLLLLLFIHLTSFIIIIIFFFAFVVWLPHLVRLCLSPIIHSLLFD